MNCRNCQVALAENSDYCYTCGGKVIRNRLTLKHLFNYFIETFFNYDNKFLQTIIKLISNPKDVIDSYVNGTRKRYIEPLAFFAISLTISGIYIFIVRKYVPELFEFDELYQSDAQKEFAKKITDITTEYISLLNFAIIPVLAFISRIVFYNNRYNYTEHLVIGFYTMSLFSMFSVVSTLIIASFFPTSLLTVSMALYLVFFFYYCYLTKQLFDLSFKQLLVKIVIFIPLFFMFYLGFSILMVLIAFATGSLNLQDFAPSS